MPGDTTAWRQNQAPHWTPHLIKRLRGKRTQAAFGALLGAPKNTVWRWESGQAYPDARYIARLSELARQEHFLTDWQLAGSMTLLGDLESARADIAKLFRTSLQRSSRQLAE
jgi:transcriptional regulator with XRE-family HTH domain